MPRKTRGAYFFSWNKLIFMLINLKLTQCFLYKFIYNYPKIPLNIPNPPSDKGRSPLDLIRLLKYNIHTNCGCGEIGIHDGFRFHCPRACRFKSCHPHQFECSYGHSDFLSCKMSLWTSGTAGTPLSAQPHKAIFYIMHRAVPKRRLPWQAS